MTVIVDTLNEVIAVCRDVQIQFDKISFVCHHTGNERPKAHCFIFPCRLVRERNIVDHTPCRYTVHASCFSLFKVTLRSGILILLAKRRVYYFHAFYGTWRRHVVLPNIVRLELLPRSLYLVIAFQANVFHHCCELHLFVL